MTTSEHRATFSVAGKSITVVERTEIRTFEDRHGFIVTARKRPQAVVVVEDEGGEAKSTILELDPPDQPD